MQDFFDLVAFAVRKRKPNISGSVPTYEDLEAAVQDLWASETVEPPPKVAEAQPGLPTVKQTLETVATGCVPCSIGHLSICSGLLNEGMRFARDGGVASDEVISRVNMCLDELNALERVDLRPELIHGLPDWEKELAEKALSLSRSVRHDLERLPSTSELEGIAAKMQAARQEIGASWYREGFSRLTPNQRETLERKLTETAPEESSE